MPIPAILKQALAPGSIGFLILSAVIWLALRYPASQRRRVARWWALGVATAYLLMSIPLVAGQIADRLPPVPRAEGSTPAIDTLIVLDGDNRIGRVDTAARIWKTARPEKVYVLGADWVKNAIIANGVPLDRVVQSVAAGNTRDQIAWVKRYMTQAPASRTGLIASRLQMPRVAALVKTESLSLTLIASPIDDEPPRHGFRVLVPTYIGLRVSRDALYEHAALAFYSWHGWIRKAPG